MEQKCKQNVFDIKMTKIASAILKMFSFKNFYDALAYLLTWDVLTLKQLHQLRQCWLLKQCFAAAAAALIHGVQTTSHAPHPMMVSAT